MKRYYSIMRPVSIGTYPKNGAEEIVNFDRRQFCPEIQRNAWGYIEYSWELTEKEAAEYELIPASAETP